MDNYYDKYIKTSRLLDYMRTFTAVIHREEDLYVAECPEVGTASQGRTIEEAVSNLK